ncbi:MAG: hypothetical protein NT031_00420 [Planctomycetota bacterium]|nr:hypothetical protein [Planctomycetota bacterium]
MKARRGSRRRNPWAASADPRAGEWVAKNAPAMDAMVRASHRPRFFLPRQPRDKSTLEDLGSRLGVTVLSPMLHASRSLLVRAALAGRAGRMKEAWADVLAVHRLGRLVAEQPDVITMMTGGAIEMSAAQFTWKLVANTPLSAEQARAMQGDLAALPPMSPGARHIDWGERIFDLGITLETIQNPREEPWRPHTQKLGPNSKFQPRPEAAAWLDFLMAMLRSPRVRKSVDWDQVLRLTNANFDELVALLKLPTYADRVIAFDGLTKRADARIAAAREAQARAASRPADIGDPAPGTIVGIFESFSSFMDLGRDVLLLAGSAPDRVAMERRMSMTVLALAAYRGDKGGYPVELAALVGKYLEAMPVDFYDGRALRYRRTEKGYVLYSIGPDMVDQEGRSDKGGGYDIAVWMGQNPPGPATKPAP